MELPQDATEANSNSHDAVRLNGTRAAFKAASWWCFGEFRHLFLYKTLDKRIYISKSGHGVISVNRERENKQQQLHIYLHFNSENRLAFPTDITYSSANRENSLLSARYR